MSTTRASCKLIRAIYFHRLKRPLSKVQPKNEHIDAEITTIQAHRVSSKTYSKRSLTLFPWPAQYIRWPGKATIKAIRSFWVLKLKPLVICVDAASLIGAHLSPHTWVDIKVSIDPRLGPSEQHIVVTTM